MTVAQISAKSNTCQTKSREVDWYHPNLTWLPEVSAKLFVEYSGLPKEQILDHIHRIREKAWEVYVHFVLVLNSFCQTVHTDLP